MRSTQASGRFFTGHLRRYPVQLLTQDVVVGVDEGQLLHHGLFRDEVENLCDFPVLDDGHAPDRVLPLDPVQNHHFVAVAGAADPPQAAEVEQARHARSAGRLRAARVQAADGRQLRNHKADPDGGVGAKPFLV